MWVHSLHARILRSQNANVSQGLVISDVRFQNELDMLKKCGAILYRVSRGDPPEWAKYARGALSGDRECVKLFGTTYSHLHVTEWMPWGLDVDGTIYNDGSISDLESKVTEIVSSTPTK